MVWSKILHTYLTWYVPVSAIHGHTFVISIYSTLKNYQWSRRIERLSQKCSIRLEQEWDFFAKFTFITLQTPKQIELLASAIKLIYSQHPKLHYRVWAIGQLGLALHNEALNLTPCTWDCLVMKQEGIILMYRAISSISKTDWSQTPCWHFVNIYFTATRTTKSDIKSI